MGVTTRRGGVEVRESFWSGDGENFLDAGLDGLGEGDIRR